MTNTTSQSVPWRLPTILAPMEGVSHALFRQLTAESGGLGMVCTEFIRISRAPLNRKLIDREIVRAEGVPLSVQVMGNEEDKMAEAAAWIADGGADVVDINLGCPAPRAVRHGVGSAMLKDPELLNRVVTSMRAAVPGLLSAKIRAGFNESEHVYRNARILVDAGVDFIAVHPRRRADFYEGVSDWRIIRGLVEELPIPVIGNGDVWYADDALRMIEETGCDAVMIGRPALRNPWLFQQVAALLAGEEPPQPSGAELAEWLRMVAGRYDGHFGRAGRGSIGKLKELVSWMIRTIDRDHPGRSLVLRAKTVDELLERFDEVFTPLDPEQVDIQAHGPARRERSGSANAA